MKQYAFHILLSKTLSGAISVIAETVDIDVHRGTAMFMVGGECLASFMLDSFVGYMRKEIE